MFLCVVLNGMIRTNLVDRTKEEASHVRWRGTTQQIKKEDREASVP